MTNLNITALKELKTRGALSPLIVVFLIAVFLLKGADNKT